MITQSNWCVIIIKKKFVQTHSLSGLNQLQTLTCFCFDGLTIYLHSIGVSVFQCSVISLNTELPIMLLFTLNLHAAMSYFSFERYPKSSSKAFVIRADKKTNFVTQWQLFL